MANKKTRTDRELITAGEHPNVSIDGTTGAATVSLYYPIKSGSEKITEFTLQRPRAKHLRAMDESDEGDLGKTFALVAALSSHAPAEIDLLDAADVALLSMVVGFLQQPPRRTGSSS
jgi:hypothetical protein